jgi:hypothetical protein
LKLLKLFQLKLQPAKLPRSSKSRSACLEAVAEIFDDLLLTMHEEDSDEVHIRVLHAQLASTMWEALVCCAAVSSGSGSNVQRRRHI